MKWGPAFWSLIALFIFAFPSLVSAQVVINEIMYNPQGSDPGREWIELYNEGQSDVTMVGGSGKGSWRISDGSNHTLTDPVGGTGRGSLTIPAGGYLIVANDPTDFISGEYAGGTYSVVKSSISLNNTGATVTLLDGTGATVDSVAYSPSQGGNDDSSSLQRQADGSWIAALPTPGAANSSTVYVAPSTGDQNSQNTTQTNSGSGATSSDQSSQSGTSDQDESYVAPPTPSLYADAGADRTVIVGADVEFDANAYDKSQNILDPSTVRFVWNFGDGASAEGSSVLHHFWYPGRYAVVLDIAQARNAASDQVIVTAEPASLIFSLLPDGGVDIQNVAGHDLDLSDWIVRESANAFSGQFMLPEHSEILSGSSMNISSQTLLFRASSSTMLEYPNGVLAFAMGESSSASTSQEDAQTPQIVDDTKDSAVAKPAPAQSFSAVGSVADQSPMDPDPDATQQDATDTSATVLDTDPADSAPPATSTILQTAAASSAPASKYLWWFGVLALAAAAIAAVLAAAHFKKGEWDFVEDTAE